MDCVYIDKTPLLVDFRRVERASALRRELLMMILTSGRAGSGRRKRSNCETPFTLRRRKTPQQFSYRTSSRTNQGARTTLHQQLSTPSTISLRPPNKNSSLQLKPYVLQNCITPKFHKLLHNFRLLSRSPFRGLRRPAQEPSPAMKRKCSSVRGRRRV